MGVLFVQYPKCSTCQKAAKWLAENGVEFESRHIVEQRPSADELREWISRSGKDVGRFFNTSGMLYRELGLKDKLPQMDDEERIALLSTNGMLVKRPIVVAKDFVLVGFKPSEWERLK